MTHGVSHSIGLIALSQPGWATVAAIIASLAVVAGALRLAELVPSRWAYLRWSVGRQPISGVFQTRSLWVAVGCFLMMIALMLLGLTVGDFPIPASDALTTALWDRTGEYHFVINSLRFPRITVAVLAGMCLAASGAIFQSLVGNPLVSPDIIGINNGAAICAVFILAAGGNVSLLPYAAFAGALTTAIVIYVLAWKKGVSGSRLVLVGIGINAVLAAGITFVQVRFPIERVVAAARWQAGTLFGASWDDVQTLAVAMSILFPAAFILIRRLRILQLGDDTAAALGIHVERDRLMLIATGAGLAAIAVAVVGPLSFVALLVPHFARLLVGNLTGGVLVVTALLGAVFLLGADLIAQRLFAPVSLPAGVATAAIGGPYFLFLLARHNRDS